MSDPRIDGYARGLFEIARAEGTLDEVEDELFRFARVLESNDELRTTLTDAALPVSRRQRPGCFAVASAAGRPGFAYRM